MKTTLAILGVDGQRNSAGKSFLASGVTFAHNARGEVPVWLAADDPTQRDWAHVLGRAKLSVHDGVLWADCDLLDDKLPGSLVKILYPHVCGKVVKVHGDIVQELVVDAINISLDHPQDSRITSLAAQGVRSTKRG